MKRIAGGGRAAAWLVAVVLAGLALAVPSAFADGTETLGAPSVPLASGTGALVAGVGTELGQPASFTFSVPGTPKQVLLYWTGHSSPPAVADSSVALAAGAAPATVVDGTSIGGPTCFFVGGGVSPCPTADDPENFVFQTFRADITALGLVHSGSNALTVSGLDFRAADGFGNDGAGVVVIYDDGSTSSVAGLRDGQDLAFAGFSGALQTTVPQTFAFAAASTARTATLSTLAASVEGPASGFGSLRPNQLVLTFDVGGTQILQNPWGSTVGPEYDAVNLPVTIPAGASQVTVQAVSAPDPASPGARPASLAWTAAALTVPNPSPTNPGTGTPGFWKNHPQAWPVTSITLGSTTYTKSQAIAILQTPPRGDDTIILAYQLISAKLNGLIGNDTSCVASTIAAADAYLTAHPVGSNVRSDSTATSLAATLDDYNNGRLCAPHRA